jgi:hypothetical protein
MTALSAMVMMLTAALVTAANTLDEMAGFDFTTGLLFGGRSGASYGSSRILENDHRVFVRDMGGHSHRKRCAGISFHAYYR